MPEGNIHEILDPVVKVNTDNGTDSNRSGGDKSTTKLAKGDKDWNDDVVEKIYYTMDKFVIYAIKDDIRVRNYLSCEKPEEVRKKLVPIVGTMAVIVDVIFGLRGSHVPGQETPEWKALFERSREIQACAIRLAFEDQTPAAEALLNDFKGQVERRRDSRNRMHYIVANVVALAVILFAWWAANRFGVPEFLHRVLVEPIPVGSGAFRPVDVLVLGALGAFFSVSVGVNAVSVNHALTLWEMIYTGFVRVPIGVLAATVVVMLIKGGWILATVEDQYMMWTVFLFGFLAGFSEFFVPNALKQVEASATVKTPTAE
jgi:hypothetical protein